MIFTSLLTALAAFGLGAGVPADDPPALELGSWLQAEFDLSDLSDSRAHHTVLVPIDAVALQVELVCRRADLDLFVWQGEEEDPTVSMIEAGDLGSPSGIGPSG
jgi:hypothetical protein